MVAGARTFSLEETYLSPQILNPPPTRHALLAFLLALAALLHIGTAGWGDLFDGTEGQFAGGAREMVESDRWLVPTNDGAPLVEAPPLAYWAVAFTYKAFGVRPTAARLPVAFATIGAVALTFLIGERLAGYWRGDTLVLVLPVFVGTLLTTRFLAPHATHGVFLLRVSYVRLRE